MLYSYANNLQAAGESFHKRRFYDEKIMPFSREEIRKDLGDEYIDIFVTKPLYGRIDNRSDSVFTGIKTRSTLNSQLSFNNNYYTKKFINYDLYAINFVVDAFEDFAKYVNYCCKTQNDLVKIGPYASIAPIRAYEDPIQNYFNYFYKVIDMFVNLLVESNSHYLNKLTSYEEFMNVFFNFCLKNTESFSILFSSFMLSKHNFPGTTGMVVEISNDDYGDDFEFIKSC